MSPPHPGWRPRLFPCPPAKYGAHATGHSSVYLFLMSTARGQARTYSLTPLDDVVTDSPARDENLPEPPPTDTQPASTPSPVRRRRLKTCNRDGQGGDTHSRNDLRQAKSRSWLRFDTAFPLAGAPLRRGRSLLNVTAGGRLRRLSGAVQPLSGTAASAVNSRGAQ
jgi:hypothetical protein